MKKNKDTLKALVTGATRGIGLSISERLIKDGVSVISTGTKADSFYAKGSEFIQVDFLDDNSVKEFFRKIESEDIDILINNAGINRIDEFTNISEKEFDQILHVNLRMPFLISQKVVRTMKENNWGRIINIASIFSKVSKEFRASYSVSKFGLDGLTAAMSAELSQHNILINTVSPGFVDTDLTRKVLGKAGIEEIIKSVPSKRLANTEEISSFVSWLVSEENTYVSGQNLIIDGGFVRV